jgi:hypothetical protein
MAKSEVANLLWALLATFVCLQVVCGAQVALAGHLQSVYSSEVS